MRNIVVETKVKPEKKRVYIITNKNLKAAGFMVTIGFEPETAYIANALEIFLNKF